MPLKMQKQTLGKETDTVRKHRQRFLPVSDVPDSDGQHTPHIPFAQRHVPHAHVVMTEGALAQIQPIATMRQYVVCYPVSRVQRYYVLLKPPNKKVISLSDGIDWYSL